MFDFILHWLDFLWIPAAFFLLEKEQRWKGIFFILSCMLTLRLQVEFFVETGGETGFLPFLKSHVLYRGYVVYGLFIGGFLTLGHISKKTDAFVYLAASISVYTVCLCVSSLVMLL